MRPLLQGRAAGARRAERRRITSYNVCYTKLLRVFLPLLGAILAGLFGRFIGRIGSQIVTSLLMVVSAGLSIPVLLSVGFGAGPFTVTLFDWIHVGSFDVSWALKVDTLTAAMLFTRNNFV